MKYADLAQGIDFLGSIALKSGGSSSKPIILGEPSEIGEFADSCGFLEDPPILKLFRFESLDF